MKRQKFITCVAFVVASLSLSAQEKTRHIEKDGFEWYETINDGKHGAQDANGRTIIPCRYKIVSYEDYKVHYFKVCEDTYWGVCRVDGVVIIPTDRRYTSCYGFEPSSGEDFLCFSCNKDDGQAVCDMDGRELCFIKDATFISPTCAGGRFYYDFVVKENDIKLWGLADGKGKIIVKAKYENPLSVWSSNEITAKKDGERIVVGRATDISTTENPYKEPSTRFRNWMLAYAFGENTTSVQADDVLASVASDDDVKKELRDEGDIADGFKWYLTTRDGKHGAQNLEGKSLVPLAYESVWYSPFSGGLEGKLGEYYALYTTEGKCIFGIDREYTSILRTEDEYYGPYYVVYAGESAGACDIEGVNIVPPTRGYDNVQLTKVGETVCAIVEKNDMMGICDRWGKEIVPPQYNQLGFTNSGTIAYVDDNGNGHDLGIRPDGTKASSDYASSSSSSSYDAKAAKKQARRAAWAAALGAMAAGGAAVAAARMGTPAAGYTMPQVNPYGTGSAAGAMASTDRIIANAQQNIQMIGQQAMNQAQQGINRSQRALQEQLSWSTSFNAQNGRYPTDLEKDEWMRQHYPDVYQVMIQARAAQTVREGSVESDDTKDSEQKKVSNTYKCAKCNGTGRLLQEDEVLNFGLPTKKDYKCQECGKWKYKGMTHRHYDCPDCKGKGTYTFD